MNLVKVIVATSRRLGNIYEEENSISEDRVF